METAASFLRNLPRFGIAFGPIMNPGQDQSRTALRRTFANPSAAALLCAAAAARCLAAEPPRWDDTADRAEHASRCATPEASAAVLTRVEDNVARYRAEHLATADKGAIRVVFHLLGSRVSDEQITDRLRDLNRAFEATGYRFHLARVNRSRDPQWSGITRGGPAESAAKEALAVDPAHHLNVYVSAAESQALGWATAPWEAPEGDVSHGVVVSSTILSAGMPADSRHPLIHQIGHYLGLSDQDLAQASLGRPQQARMDAIVPVYRPSLFARAAEAAPGALRSAPEIGGQEMTHPADLSRAIEFRGAFPNPFRSETAIRFALPSASRVTLRVFNVSGQLVQTLMDATLPAGEHSAMFTGRSLPSGAYFLSLQVGELRMNRTVVLVR